MVQRHFAVPSRDGNACCHGANAILLHHHRSHHPNLTQESMDGIMTCSCLCHLAADPSSRNFGKRQSALGWSRGCGVVTDVRVLMAVKLQFFKVSRLPRRRRARRASIEILQFQFFKQCESYRFLRKALARPQAQSPRLPRSQPTCRPFEI